MSEPKRFKRDYTSIEQLPNELFVEIFGYLTGVDSVDAFSQLNNRFQSLLNNYVTIFDFKFISKAKFDFITQHYDIHQWRSLRLSDDDHTPGQIKLFCQLFPPAQYISQLQSLSVLNMQPKYAQGFLLQLVSFDHLVSLTIGNICGENIVPFELPSLRHLVITSCKQTEWITNFFSLENVEYTVQHNCHHYDILELPTSIKRLKLFYDEKNDADAIRTLLHQLPQLMKLALYDNGSRSPLPNGRKWEDLIQLSLPLLKTFQFCFPFHCYRSTPNDLKQTIASFSTPFYVSENHWFIRCDSDTRYSAIGVIYSLPFAFSEMPINITSFDTSMSTLIPGDIDEIRKNSYEKVKTLVFNEKCQVPNQGFLSSSITKLILKTSLPSNWLFLLTNLRHLGFQRTLHMSSTDFAHLLANTPQLQSLTIPIMVLTKLTEKFTNTAVCDQLSQRVQSLTICHYFGDGGDLGIVSVRVLSSLVRTFSKNCAHLSLALAAHPNTVLPILRRMRQLRSLHIRCHSWCRTSNVTATSWFEQPPTEINSSDFMHISDDYDFYIWFGNRT